MLKIETKTLLEVYEKALKMNLERDFINIIKLELMKREARINKENIVAEK